MSGFHRLHALRMENDAAGYTMEEMRPRFERIAARHENGTAPRAVAAYQLFQTPAEIANRMVEALKPGARVLEPSAGLGRLLDAIARKEPRETVAVEKDVNLCRELFLQNRNGVRILQRDFLTVTREELGQFDFIVMNPPFHMRSDIQHIEHALRFLAPGGTLVAVCLDGYQRRQKLNPTEWIPLPAGCFKAEGTNVATAICIFHS